MTRESVPRSWSAFSLFLPTTTARMKKSEGKISYFRKIFMQSPLLLENCKEK